MWEVVSSVPGLLVGISLMAASPLTGNMFHDSRLPQVSAARSGMLLLRSWSDVAIRIMYRGFQCKQRMTIDLAVKCDEIGSKAG
jgi:hypothetical protein